MFSFDLASNCEAFGWKVEIRCWTWGHTGPNPKYLFLHLLASEILYHCVINSKVALICAFRIFLTMQGYIGQYMAEPSRYRSLYDVINVVQKERKQMYKVYSTLVGPVNQLFSINKRLMRPTQFYIQSHDCSVTGTHFILCSGEQHGVKGKKRRRNQISHVVYYVCCTMLSAVLFFCSYLLMLPWPLAWGEVINFVIMLFRCKIVSGFNEFVLFLWHTCMLLFRLPELFSFDRIPNKFFFLHPHI